MPADYVSAARALSLSPNPPSSPSEAHADVRPPWIRNIGGTSGRRLSANRFGSRPSQSRRTTALSGLNRAAVSAVKAGNRLWGMYLALSPVQRVAVAACLLALNVLIIVLLVYSHAIFQWLGPVSEKWRALPGGWLIIWAFTFLTAFPPMIGYSSAITISGFVYGFPLGYPIVATATVAGSLTAFYTSRGIFSGYVHRLVGQDHRFIALGQVLRKDGLGMLTAVRFCPLPYSLSNGFLSTIPTIKPWVFAASTALASPKLLVHVFVGWVIYQRTMARAAELALEEAEESGLVPGRDNAPDYSDVEAGLVDPEDVAALMDEDDISLWAREADEEGGYRDYDDTNEQQHEATDDTTRTTQKGAAETFHDEYDGNGNGFKDSD